MTHCLYVETCLICPFFPPVLPWVVLRIYKFKFCGRCIAMAQTLVQLLPAQPITIFPQRGCRDIMTLRRGNLVYLAAICSWGLLRWHSRYLQLVLIFKNYNNNIYKLQLHLRLHSQAIFAQMYSGVYQLAILALTFHTAGSIELAHKLIKYPFEIRIPW